MPGGSDDAETRPAKTPALSRRATLDDIARLAGVSAATVSRAFTPGSSISPEKKARILSASAKIGYRPNVMARAMMTRRSHVVGLILFNETNLRYPEVLLSLANAFSQHSIRVMLFPLEEQEDLNDVIEQVLSYQIDGVVSAAPIPDQHIEALARGQVPAVFYNRPAADLISPSVSCDHRVSGNLIATQVADAGHRRVALIRGYDGSAVGEERIGGVIATLDKRGVEIVDSVESDYTYEGGGEAVRGWLGRGPLSATVIIAANDMMAIGAKDVLVHEAGLGVPRDVSLVGFDGIHASRWLCNALTTVGQPIERMASATASIMIERIANPDTMPERRLFPGLLVEGSSLGPPPAG